MAADLFSLLSARYGVGTALQLMQAFSPDASGIQKGFGAAGALGSGATAAGALSDSPGLAALGKGLGTALGAAGLGYGLYNTITNPNLSPGQKAGTAGLQTGEGAVALSPALASATAGTAMAPAFAALAPAAPYLAGLLAAQAVSGQLEKSGSPQLRATGRAIGAPILPITGLEGVITGQQSPRAAANATIEGMKQTPILGGPIGKMLGFMGLGTAPTTGTMFRHELGNVFGQLGPLKGTNIQNYQAPNQANALDYSMFAPDALSAGQQLGKILSAYAPHGKANPDAYALQAQNILLNQYGNNLPAILNQVLPLLQGKPQSTQTMVNQ